MDNFSVNIYETKGVDWDTPFLEHVKRRIREQNMENNNGKK